MFGAPLDSHAVLFEDAQFHGSHQHVFQPVTDLGDFGFSQITSSIVVESGNWTFFGDTQFDDSYPGDPVFGPGIYPWVVAVGIQNDDIASLQPTTLDATFSNAVDDKVLLFQYGDFFGPHKHVFAAEPNLNASDDNDFNDRVNSLAIVAGELVLLLRRRLHRRSTTPRRPAPGRIPISPRSPSLPMTCRRCGRPCLSR